MKSLFVSRKFWLMVIDITVSISAYFVGKYANPSISQDILWMIGILQPVMISLIMGIALEDAALKSTFTDSPEEDING